MVFERFKKIKIHLLPKNKQAANHPFSRKKKPTSKVPGLWFFPHRNKEAVPFTTHVTAHLADPLMIHPVSSNSPVFTTPGIKTLGLLACFVNFGSI